MPAYLVVTAQIHDRDAFLSGYAPRAAALVEQFGGRYLVRARNPETLEGEPLNAASVVVSEWPTREAAMAFWDSAEYQEVAKLREGVADCTVTLVSA
jgi:uncharacterized protein (DUF1330 family)